MILRLNNQLPSVSIAIPTYNEAEHIEIVVRKFLATKYPNLIEILVVDGGSTDSTPTIVIQLNFEDPRVKLIHNPKKLQAPALNLALQKSQGEIFLRADAHCDYASDYIEKCVEVLLKSKALNVGGAQRFVAKNSFQAGIALASRSWFGSGGAKYRNPNYNGFAETVFLGCFWKKTLESMGGYCETSTPNEDSELNLRLAQISSQPIYVSSKIKVWYYPRRTWKSLWIQYFKYGSSRYTTTIKHKSQSQLRGKLPCIAVSTLILLFIFDLLFTPFDLHLKELYLLGLLFPGLESLRINLKFNRNFMTEFWRGKSEQTPSFLARWLTCFLVILTIPIAHFSGYGYQLFRYRVLNYKIW